MGAPDPTTNASRWDRFSSRMTRTAWGVVLVALGLALAVLLALIGGKSNAAVEALIVIAIGATQFGSAWVFNGVGRVETPYGRRSVARLVRTSRRAAVAEAAAQTLYEADPAPANLQAEVGRLSTELSWIGEDLLLSIDDWLAIGPHFAPEVEQPEEDKHGQP